MSNMTRFKYVQLLLIPALIAGWGLDLYFSNGAGAQEKNAFLADRHGDRGQECDSCHKDNATKGDVPSEVCMECHGDRQQIMALTEEVMPNPHDSHEDLICGNCHHGHKASENSCIQCHEFEFKVP